MLTGSFCLQPAVRGWRVLRLAGGQVESLFDEALPAEVRELPEDLARLDALADGALLAPIERAWDRAAREHGRPTIAMSSYVRLMVVKQRTGWGYETLVREVSDSLHLRRFCLFALTERLPDESTIRKLTRRLGPEVVDEITRLVIDRELREKRFVARAMRVDSTVVEADVRYPNDAALAVDATRRLASEAATRGTLRGSRPAGAGSLAGGRPAAAGDQPHARTAHRRSEGEPPCAHRRGRCAGRGAMQGPSGRVRSTVERAAGPSRPVSHRRGRLAVRPVAGQHARELRAKPSVHAERRQPGLHSRLDLRELGRDVLGLASLCPKAGYVPRYLPRK